MRWTASGVTPRSRAGVSIPTVVTGAREAGTRQRVTSGQGTTPDRTGAHRESKARDASPGAPLVAGWGRARRPRSRGHARLVGRAGALLPGCARRRDGGGGGAGGGARRRLSRADRAGGARAVRAGDRLAPARLPVPRLAPGGRAGAGRPVCA